MFEAIIRRNQIKTMAVLALYMGIFIFIGLLGDLIRINASSFSLGILYLITFRIFPLITVIMLLIALGVIFFSLSHFRQIMLSGNEYKELTRETAHHFKEQELLKILDELLYASQTPFKPKLFLMEAPYMNAFASGWNQHNSLIAFTTALTYSLDRDELKAVMAHELSHIRHGDIRLTLCVGILSNIMVLALNLISMAFFGGNRNEGSQMAKNILFILSFILPFITLFLQLFLSRSREYMADSGAAYMMGDHRPMVRALQKISGNYQKYDFKDVDTNPTRKAAYIFGISEAFSTHPSIENRIKALMGR